MPERVSLPPACGTTCFVYGRLHPAMNSYPLLIDSGAGISLIPKRWYDSIPDDDKPPLQPTTLTVRTGNKVRINMAGMIDVSLRLSCGNYPCRFYVSSDEVHGILGMDFMEAHHVDFQAARKKLFIGNRPVTLYSERGHRLNHRIVAQETIFVPPSHRFIVPGRLTGVGEVEGSTVLIEGAKRLPQTTGVITPSVLAIPHHNQVPMEVYNLTEEIRTIKQGTTLGVVTNVFDVYPADPLFTTPTEESMPSEVTVNTRSVQDDSNLSDTQVPAHVRSLYDLHADSMSDAEKRAFADLLIEYADVFAENKTDLGRTSWVKHHINTGDEPPFKHRPYRLPQAKYDEMKRQVETLHEKGIIRPSTSNWSSNVLLVKKKDNTWRMCIDYRDLNRKTKNVDPYMLPRIDDTLDQLGNAKYFCTLDLISGYHQVELTEESKPKTAFTTPRMNPSQWEYNCMPFGVQGGPATFQRLMDKLLAGLDYRVALAYLDDIIVYGCTRLECIERLRLVFSRLRDAGLKLKPTKCTLFATETLYLGHVVSGEGIKCDPKKIEAVKNWVRPTTPRQALIFISTCNYYGRFIKNFSEIALPLRKLSRSKKNFEWTPECEQSFQLLRQALISDPVMAYPQPDGQYILDTDASGFAIGAVLSQMQPDDSGELVERVISYGSRMLHGREQMYCTRRRELLAIVEFVKRFKAYLWGRHVLIRTDHASLKYIKTQNNPDDQFARWVERLEEILYTIEIRKGTKHCNADGLSRYPSTTCGGKRCICIGVGKLEAAGDTADSWQNPATFNEAVVNEHAVILSDSDDWESCDTDSDHQSPPVVEVNAFAFTKSWIADELAVAQEADPDIGPVYTAKRRGTRPAPNEYNGESAATKAYFHDWERLVLKPNGLLYRVWESDDGDTHRLQLLLPYSYRESMYHHLHESKLSCHMGKRRVLHRMQRKYYWYRMADDLKLWIQTCEVCQMRKKPGKPAKAPLTIHLSGMPNERVALDVLGPLAPSAAGNTCILVITDHFSKYTKAIAMPNQQATTIAAVLDKEWISIFGAPRTIHSDQGSAFESDLFQELCKLLQIEKTRTTAYHPQGNSQCERFNSTLLNMIHAHASKDPVHWDTNLHHITLFYNATKHTATDIEPNRIMFGRNVELPVDVMMPVDPLVQPRTPIEYVRNMERELRAAYVATRSHLKRAATAQKKYYDRSSHLYKYKEGDIVKLRRFRKEPGTGKYADRYEGPYYILDILGDVTFRIVKDKTSHGKVVHHDHILPYFPKHASENVNNAWVLRKSKTYKAPTKQADVACQASGRPEAPSSLSAASHHEEHPELPQPVSIPRKRVAVTAFTQDDVSPIVPLVRKRGRPRKPIAPESSS